MKLSVVGPTFFGFFREVSLYWETALLAAESMQADTATVTTPPHINTDKTDSK